MQEFPEPFRSYNTEARCKISNLLPGHPAGNPVVESVGKASTNACLATPGAGTDNHIETLLESVQQELTMLGTVLAIRIHENQDVA